MGRAFNGSAHFGLHRLLPFIITGLVLAWDRFVRRRRDPSLPAVRAGATLLLAVIGVANHPALDWLNIYGIRFLMPFSDTWFFGDGMFIIDPWIWLALGSALFLPRRTARRVRVLGAVTVAYVLLMLGGSRVAERTAWRVAEAQGITGITEVMYAPRPAQPHVGGLIVVTPSEYRLGEYRWLSAHRVRLDGAAASIQRGDWDAEVVRRAMSEDDVRDYLTWSRFPFVRTEAVATGTAVFFGDARFTEGPSGGGLQGVRVVVPQ